MNKLVIVHLRSAEFFGGPERAILGQCRSQPDVDFICTSFVRRGKPNIFLDNAKKAGFETAQIHDSFAGDFRVISQLKKLVTERRVDILVSHDYKANFFGRLAVKGTGTRQIAHFRGETQENLKDKMYNRINARVMRKIRTVLAVSGKSAAILEAMGVPSMVIQVVPNAIENEKLVEPGFAKKHDPDRPRQVVAAGRLSFEKGYDVLLRAVALAKPKAPEFVVNIYGFGPEQDNLTNLARELNISDAIAFRGFVDDMLPVFRQADFMVLPSRSEGMPNVILEAWSQKLGVVSTAVGGVPEMIEPRKSGLLCPSENPEALADELVYALARPEEMIRFGEEGFLLVQNQYCYSKQAETLQKIYWQVMQVPP